MLIMSYPIDKPTTKPSPIVGGTSFEIRDEYHGVLIPSNHCSGNWEIKTENGTELITKRCGI